MVRHWHPLPGQVSPSEGRRELSPESWAVKVEGLSGTDTVVDDVEGALAAVLGGWEWAGSGPGAILKMALIGVPSTSELILPRPKVGDSPLRFVKSLKSKKSLDQSVLAGASEEDPGRAEALLVESGGAEGDVRRPSLFQSLPSGRVPPPFSPSRLRREGPFISTLVLPCWFIVEDLSLSVVEDDRGTICRRRRFVGPLLLPIVLPLP